MGASAQFGYCSVNRFGVYWWGLEMSLKAFEIPNEGQSEIPLDCNLPTQLTGNVVHTLPTIIILATNTQTLYLNPFHGRYRGR